jgi:hypothetical protein
LTGRSISRRPAAPSSFPRGRQPPARATDTKSKRVASNGNQPTA